MRSQEGYKTRQKDIIEKALKESSGKHITVDGLTALLLQNGESVGRTTVYRFLEKMAVEGKVRKYHIDSRDSTCYQYVENHKCHEHFHLKCEDCGRLIHIECASLDSMCEHMGEEHGFKIDKFKTVLYGLCGECAAK